MLPPAGLPSLDIVVPVRDEAEGLAAALRVLDRAAGLRAHRNRRVVLVEGGSTDGTRTIARRWCRGRAAWRLVAARGAATLGRSVRRGFAAGRGDAVLVLPVDCALAPPDFAAVEAAVAAGTIWGGFAKRYAQGGPLLRAYAALQNVVLARRRGLLVWTNAIFARRDQLVRAGGIPARGFLDDVVLADRLGRVAGPLVLPGPVVVSARRYLARGVLRQMVRNALILAAYRWLRVPPGRLRRWYVR